MIQKLLIQYILMPLAAVMERFSDKTKERIFVAAGLGIALQYMWGDSGLPIYRYVVFYVVGCLLTGIMILCTLHTRIQPVRFRWSVMGFWLGTGVMILQASLRLNFDYVTEAIIFLAAFPVVFICWNNADRTWIFKMLLKVIRITAVIFMISCLLFAKITTERYQGIFNNPNGMAYLLMLAAACQFVEILYAKRLGWRCLADILILGCSVALCYYTNSRTGYLGLICAVVAAGGVYVLTHDWKENGKCMIRVSAAALVTLVCVFNLVYLFQWRTQFDIPYYNPEQGIIYDSTGILHDFGEAEDTQPAIPAENRSAPAPIPAAEPVKSAPSGIAGFQNTAQQKGETENKSLDDISTGRITLWKAYASGLNLFGHESVPTVYVPLTGQTISSTHMTCLQFAYESGLFAGVFYLLLNIISGLLTIWFAWKYREEKYAVMPLAVTIVFGVGSMLSTCTLAFAYMITFYYYCTLFPIMVHQPAAAENKE